MRSNKNRVGLFFGAHLDTVYSFARIWYFINAFTPITLDFFKFCYFGLRSE